MAKQEHVTKKYTTGKGQLVGYISLQTPSTKFDKDGVYSTSILLSKEEGERLLSESTHRTLTEAIDDISLGNFQTKLKKVILNLKEAYDDLNPNVDKFDVASTIINGSLNDLKMLDKAIQEFNSEETM